MGKEPAWRKSNSCATSTCVEVAEVGGQYLIRDSKKPDAPHLSFTKEEWVVFVEGVTAGEFNFE